MPNLGKKLAAGKRYAIFDDVLAKHEYDIVWRYVQNEEYRFIQSGPWHKVFRLHDGQSLYGPTYASGPAKPGQIIQGFPTGKGIDVIINRIQSSVADVAEYVGVFGKDWDVFTAKSFIYPVGAQLGWHRDAADKTGAFAFYAHPEWNVQWGGELFIIDTSLPELEQLRVQRGVKPGATDFSSFLDNVLENELLSETGIGLFVVPKPNRLVLIRGDTFHAIKRVDRAAGDRARCSISGFFMRPGV